MKKLLSAFLSIIMICSLTACDSNSPENKDPNESKEPEMETLELAVSEWITCKENGRVLNGIIGEDKITTETQIIATSNDETIATIDEDKIIIGNKYGETTVEIILNNNQKGVLNIKVVPYLEYLQHRMDGTFFHDVDYYASKWIINNLDSFKNPSTVYVNGCYLLLDEIERGRESNEAPSFFIMEIRAQNGFGGNSVDYFKVTPYSIEKVYITKDYFGNPYYYNQQVFSYGTVDYSVNDAIADHIEDNY